jgi:hypothetical protein
VVAACGESGGARHAINQGSATLNIRQDVADQRRVLDAGDHAQFAATIRAGLDINGDYALQALHSQN